LSYTELMDLFEQNSNTSEFAPLADRLRPTTFDSFFGQDHIFKKNKMLIQRFLSGSYQSLVLWGPPGCGKTSFAKALIAQTSAEAIEENAIDLGTKRIREVGDQSRRRLVEHQQRTILFVDEIHRLNRGQQDVLLPYVEKGSFFLIGATTENPSYQLNSALMSRCRLLVFEALSQSELEGLMTKAFLSQGQDLQASLGSQAQKFLVQSGHGDARKLINLIDEVLQIIEALEDRSILPMSLEVLEDLFASSGLRFDKKGDEHYDTISAFIKSIRGSDPDAGIYYLARMLEGGEDPVFIARRLVILASEDIGNGDPNGLGVAVNGLKAVELIGMPEAEICLAQVVTYLACAPKSNRSYRAIKEARTKVKETGPLPIPKSLRSAKNKVMREQGYGQGYAYAHDGPTGWVPLDFLPEALKETRFYEPSERGFEKRMSDYLKWMKQEK